jgi:hypothetical protein
MRKSLYFLVLLRNTGEIKTNDVVETLHQQDQKSSKNKTSKLQVMFHVKHLRPATAQMMR